MTNDQAWTHYFTTGDREPLVLAYWNSVRYLAGVLFPRYKEDMFQVGMIGLLKAIDKIDPGRVKSKDAWVWLNVKGMMLNAPKVKPTLAIDEWTETYTEDEGRDFDLMIGRLSARKKLILSLIYRHDWRRTEIAKLLNISSMRVGQIEQEALEEIRDQVRSQRYEIAEVLC